MNKKSNMTSVEYQDTVRQQAKERMEKFRDAQKAKGYKNLTIFLSEPFRDELEKLSKEKGMNRQDAMDYIFNIYVTNNATNNIIENEDSVTSNVIESEDSVTSNAIESEPETMAEPKTAPVETEIEPEPETIPEQAKPFNKAEIGKIVVDLKDNKKMSYAAIAKELKTMGYKPVSKNKTDFHHSTLANYYRAAKKNSRQNMLKF